MISITNNDFSTLSGQQFADFLHISATSGMSNMTIDNCSFYTAPVKNGVIITATIGTITLEKDNRSICFGNDGINILGDNPDLVIKDFVVFLLTCVKAV